MASDSRSPTSSASTEASMAPPSYHPPASDLPPTYQVAAALPTYEEAELAKAGKLDDEQATVHCVGITVPGHIVGDVDEEQGGSRSGGGGGVRGVSAGGFTFLAFPSSSLDDPLEVDDADAAALLGSDFVFLTAFLTSFLFNWIGFLLLMCFCHTIAARYGALSGFGLSLAKWTLIVKNSTDLASSDNSWLWWLITAFGMLVCMRAIFQYMHIKRTWHHLSTSARERLFFFY